MGKFFINKPAGIQNHNIQKQELFVYFAIIVSAATLFTITWPVMFAVHDDILFYLVSKQGSIIEWIIGSAKSQGRVWFLMSLPLTFFPFIFDSFIAYKTISFLSICFSVFALWFLLYRHIGKQFSLLAVLMFLTFSQIDTQHNLLISYVFSHQISIGIMLLSIERLLTYYKDGTKRALILSALLLFIATILYESFLLFTILLFLISVFNMKKLNAKKVFFDLRFHIALMSIYLIIYFLWRVKFPSSYNGVQFGSTSFFDSLRVVLTYSIGRFPLISFIGIVVKKGVIQISLLELGFFIKGFVASVATVMIIKSTEALKNKRTIYIGVLSFLGMLLPATLHSITPKYIMWVKAGSYGYIPSFYSYFFIIILLSVIAIYLYHKIKYKNVLLFLLFVFIFSGSLLTDLNNKYYANGFEEQFVRYKTFDKAVSSSYFANIENGADIYIPDYYGIHHHMPFMNDYARIYTDKNFTFTNKMEELKFDKPTYSLKYDSSSASMLMGRINKQMKADEIAIISLTPMAGKSVILNKATNGSVQVNDVDIGTFGETAIIPFNQTLDNVILESRDIYLLNSRVLNEFIQSNELLEIQWSEGFSVLEGTPEANWRWCSNSGQLRIINRSAREMQIKLQMGFASGYTDQAKLTIKSDLFIEELTINNIETEYIKELTVPPGNYVIEFLCDARRVDAPSDPRYLVFRVINFNMESLEEE